IANLLRTTRAAVREGLNVKLNIIVGFPDEKHFDIWKTFWMMLRLSFHGAHDVMVGSFAPYPGTELYDRLVDEGRITHSDEYFNKLTYLDLGGAISYSDHVSTAWLRLHIRFGFAPFYGTNYLCRPHRVFLTARNILTKRHENRNTFESSFHNQGHLLGCHSDRHVGGDRGWPPRVLPPPQLVPLYCPHVSRRPDHRIRVDAEHAHSCRRRWQRFHFGYELNGTAREGTTAARSGRVPHPRHGGLLDLRHRRRR